MNKAYSLLEVKAVDNEQRIIRGIATSPRPDRTLDVVDPFGVQVAADIPLFLYHDSTKTVGRASFGKPTSKGIPFEARLPIVTEPGTLKDRVDEAWGMVKHGLITAVSIGFRVLDGAVENLKGGGYKFLSTEVMELSLVPVPAQPDAVIQGWKSMGDEAQKTALLFSAQSIDTAARASSGSKARSGVEPAEKSAPPPGVSGTPKQPASGGFFYARKKGKDSMNIAEQIEAAKAKISALQKSMEDLMKVAADAGTTLDAAQSEEFDGHEAEVASVTAHLKRLESMQKTAVATARPVVGTSDETAAASRGGPVSVKNTQKLEKGIAFARAAKCLALGHLEHRDAIQIAKSLFGENEGIVKATQMLVTKAAVPAATTTDTTWAGALVGEETNVFADFVEFLRPMTILGRFGQGGVPGLRRVPFRVPLIGQTTGGAGYWVGEGQAKPLTKFDFNRTTLEPLKVANIAVATMEVIRDSSPSADVIIRDQLAAALRERLDIDFIDPAKAAVSGVSPASILNDVTGIVSSGTDADAVRADIKALFSAFIAANNAPTSGVWVMPATTALALSLMQNPLGQSEFPGISMTGGTLFGLPVIVSEYVPTDSSGAIVALVNASDIYLGDEGGIDLSMSTEASLQMDNAPDNPTTASTVMVSLWQRNLVGFRAERAINWARRRPTAVAYLTGVNWGAGA
ncbi:phage major capsid protein [Delftia sp. NA_296.1]|uniref:phage major capsid protein n=1 Tax=Delftia sp. NA_296.1 TaxID=3415648 RepID=UPI004046549A